MSGRRCWVEINKTQLVKNYEIYRALMPSDVDIMAVVKADAYGHGDSEVAKTLYDTGIRHFAVSNIDEAIHIRNVCPEGHILILGYTPVDRLTDLVTFGITQALLSEEYAEMISKMNLSVNCEFAIDTGMRRIGLNADEPEECERIIRKYSELLRLEGVFTHLCVADTFEQAPFTEMQIKSFEEICSKISDLHFPYCHYMNSAGGLWYSSSKSCLARLGIVLYGLKPDYQNLLPKGIEPVLSWKSVVSMVKDVMPGDTIGYGRSFTVERHMRIATIPTGYADGYPRLLSNKGWVLIHGQKAPIVGRICMDQMMVDVTDISGVVFETEVTLVGQDDGESITADLLGFLIGTIGYEIVCGINKRVDRVYIE